MAKQKDVILLADDELTVLDSLAYQLKNAFGPSYAYVLAQSVDEARQLAADMAEQGRNLRLVISDWLMPPDNSNELLVFIRERFPDVRMVMLSGYASDDAVQRAFDDAGLELYVRKPWDEQALIDKLEKLLQPAA